MGIPRTKFWADEGARRRHRSFSQPLRNTTELPWICTFWWRHRQQSIIKKVSREVCARWLSAPISAFCIPYWGTSPPKVTEALSIQELQWGYLWGWLVVEFDQGWTIIRCLLPSSWGTRGEGPWMEVPGDPSILPLCRMTEAKSPLLSVKILVIENYTKWKFRDKVMYKRIKTPSYNLVIFPSKKTNEGIGEFHRSVMFSVQHKIKWNWRYRRM